MHPRLLITLLLLAALGGGVTRGAPPRKRPEKPPARALLARPVPRVPAKRVVGAAVRALLARAEKEQPEVALKTLAEAERVAAAAGDRAGLLAVAATAHARGLAAINGGDLPSGDAF